MIFVELLCMEGRKGLRELRKEARIVGEEDKAYDLVLQAAEFKCGMSIQDTLLGPGFAEKFRQYHREQWGAYIWDGRLKEDVKIGINGDLGRHFIRTVDWVYGGPPNGKVK